MLLDEAGLTEAKIVASGDLNEYRIRDLAKPARRSTCGAWARIWCARATARRSGACTRSSTITTPIAPSPSSRKAKPRCRACIKCFRKIRNGKSEGDTVGTLPEFHVDSIPLLVEWMKDGKLVNELPSLSKLRAIARAQLDLLPEALHSFEPATDAERYPVRVSDALTALTSAVRGRELGAREIGRELAKGGDA